MYSAGPFALFFSLSILYCANFTSALRCWYCRRSEIVAEESWMTPAGSCCEPAIARCNRSYCFLAEVWGSTSFWISGCTDDKFKGCDHYRIPYNSTLSRCQCDTDLCNPIHRITRCPDHPHKPHNWTVDKFKQTVHKSPGNSTSGTRRTVTWTTSAAALPLIIALGSYCHRILVRTME